MSGSGVRRVAVVAGGSTGERTVSLRSGRAVAEALARCGHDARLLDLPELLTALAGPHDIDCVFVALHGGAGEDGTLQGLLELSGVPYTGSGVRASAICMHKPTCKAVWRAEGLPTPDWMSPAPQDPSDLGPLDLPVAVKPSCEGSSLGISRVDEAAGLAAARAAAGSGEVMLERWVEGDELTVAIVGPQTLPAVRIEPGSGFYDYEAKYGDRPTRYHCPTGYPSQVNTAVERLARHAYRAAGMSGWGRVDMIRDHRGELHLVEANTVPGLTRRSLVPMAAAAAGWDFEELVTRILDAGRAVPALSQEGPP